MSVVVPAPLESSGPWSDKTTPALRGIDGRICTICRRMFGPAQPGQTTLDRCPDDRAALVDIRAFADAGDDPLLGLTVSGQFTVLSRLGAGSMGTVYRARQEGTARDVALKILRGERAYDASSKARFEREARANSLLTSPYTVTVYDFGVAEDGSPFIAMEMLVGESLGHRLRREGHLPVSEAVRFAREALTSLAEAHEKGIIHRDIKPDNLFLSRVHESIEGQPEGVEVCKVLDFGIAKIVREEGGIDSLQTQAGTVFGTPRYMSPEQAQGKTLDARSDLYSLGIILYQMLVGRPPFEDEDAVLVMARHIKSPPPTFREIAAHIVIPDAIEQVVMQALAKTPDERPASAEHFIRLLEEAMAGGTLSSGVRRSVDPSLRGSRRLMLALATGVGVSLVVGGALALRARQTRDDEAQAAMAATGPGGSAGSASAARAVASVLPSGAASPEASHISVSNLPPADEPAPSSKKPIKSSADRPTTKVKGTQQGTKTPPVGTGKYGRFE